MKHPWHKSPIETRKAYGAFKSYLELGDGRTLVKVGALLGRPAGYVRQLERWSGTHAWVDRCTAYDAFEFEDKIDKRMEAREHFRQDLIDELKVISCELLSIALGRCTCTPHDHAHLRRCALRATQARTTALKMAIEHAGIAAPKRIELTGKDGGAVDVTLEAAASAVLGMTDTELEAVRELLSPGDLEELEMGH